LSGSNSPIIPAEITNKKIDYIIDNFSKGNANATYFIDMAKKAESKQYLFVSSAGMYKVSQICVVFASMTQEFVFEWGPIFE